MKPHELQHALTNVSAAFDVEYSCTDGFTVRYNEASGKALYFFPGYLDKPLETEVTPEQRNYFLKSQYWRPL